MNKFDTETFYFDSESVLKYQKEVCDFLSKQGLDVNNKNDFKNGMYKLFNVEFNNMPNLDENNYILAPNHVSDMDAVILGLLHDRIKIIAKKDFVENNKLMAFLGQFYDIVGIDRHAMRAQDLSVLSNIIRYLRKSDIGKHLLIFPQGTISDINKNSVERVMEGPFKLSYLGKTPVLPIFVEQVSLEAPTRIVFGDPMNITSKDGAYNAEWLQKVIELQNSLNPPARVPVLSKKHSNNNKPGDPFFQ